MNGRTIKAEGNDRLKGTVRIIQEGPKAFVVERSDLDGTYDRMDGFRTLKAAYAEYQCYRG